MEKKKLSTQIALTSVLLIIMLIFLGAQAWHRYDNWRWRGRVDGAAIELAATERHSPEDLENASDAVQEWFVYFRGCTLNRLWYDEEMAAPIELEKSGIWERDASDVLVLFADFQSGKKGACTPWYELNTHYEDYYFLLLRGENCWSVVDGEALTPPQTTHEIVTPTPTPTPAP